jgi:4-hydroxybenzoate polyprenyltransferase
MKPVTAVRDARATAVEGGSAGVARSRGGTARLVLEGMRPRQWSKNAFVLAGLVFSGDFVELGSVAIALVVTATFCLMSGAAYLLNDVADVETDRYNPRTASRPVARGALATGTAARAAICVGAVALAAAAAVNWETLVTLLGFAILQLAYSKWLKHLLFVDVMAISAGFTLRAFAGMISIHVDVSEWLLLCTALLALFLSLGKRRAEAVALAGTNHPQRRVLESYSVGLIDELIMVVTPATLVFYCVYAVGAAKSSAMLLTVPFVLYGIFRMLYMIHHGDGVSEDPATTVWRDRPLQVCIVAWALTAGIITLIVTN